jgi:hypothetical protein
MRLSMRLEGPAGLGAFFPIVKALLLSGSKQRILVFSSDIRQPSGGTVKLCGRDLLALDQGVACFAKHSVLSSNK